MPCKIFIRFNHVSSVYIQSGDAASDRAAAKSVGCNRDVITVLTRHHSTAQGRQQLWT